MSCESCYKLFEGRKPKHNRIYQAVMIINNDIKSPMSRVVLPHYKVQKGFLLSVGEEKRLIEACKVNPSCCIRGCGSADLPLSK